MTNDEGHALLDTIHRALQQVRWARVVFEAKDAHQNMPDGLGKKVLAVATDGARVVVDCNGGVYLIDVVEIAQANSMLGEDGGG